MARRSSMSRFFRLVWSQVLLALFAGLALSLFPAEWPTAPLHHIGIGLIVAAFVTVFLHLREITEYFEKFTGAVLVRDEYLRRLKRPALAELRANAARAMLRAEVDNTVYEQRSLADWMDRILYKCLPTEVPASGIYREKYHEKVGLELLTLEAALQGIGANTVEIPSERLTNLVLRITTTIWYTAVSPKREQSQYLVPYSGKGADMPHFPISSRVTVMAGSTEDDAEIMPVTATDIKLGGVSFDVPESKRLSFKDGVCPVWLRIVEYRSPERELHMLSTMSKITRGLTLDAFQVGAGPKLVFDGAIIAPGILPNKPAYGERSISLRHDDWLFEDNGYVIWWWQK